MKPKRPWQPRRPHGKPARPHEPAPAPRGRPPRTAAHHVGPRTDWGQVASWYDELVGEQGSEYQQHIVHPGALRLLGVKPGDAVLDIACGQGVFCRILHEAGVRVTGIDAARELIKLARQRGPESIRYLLGDARDLSMLDAAEFDAATCILAIQNINPIAPIFEGAARALRPGGRFVLVMMHPCFRGPKEATWGWDDEHKVQYRRVDRYMLPRKAPIVTNPGKDPDRYTWTFHKPLEAYIKALGRAGLLVDTLEEWTSHKTTQAGPRAAAENLARKEIPLFMAVRAVKVEPGAATSIHFEAENAAADTAPPTESQP